MLTRNASLGASHTVLKTEALPEKVGLAILHLLWYPYSFQQFWPSNFDLILYFLKPLCSGYLRLFLCFVLKILPDFGWILKKSLYNDVIMWYHHALHYVFITCWWWLGDITYLTVFTQLSSASIIIRGCRVSKHQVSDSSTGLNGQWHEVKMFGSFDKSVNHF